MKAILIILAIIAFFLLIAFIRPTVRIRAGKELSVVLKVLFFNIRLFPKKEKKLKLKNFQIKKFRKMRLDEEKKLLAKQKKKTAKELKKAEKEKEKEAEKKSRSIKENIGYVLELVKYVLVRALSKFGKYLRIEIRQIDITVTGEDPAKTAITFGTVVQAVSYIKELADQTLNMRYPKGKEQYIAVRVDYLSDKPTVMLDISFGIRIWQIIAVGITALRGYMFDVGKHDGERDGKKREKVESDPKDPDTPEITRNSDIKKPVKAGTEVKNGGQ